MDEFMNFMGQLVAMIAVPLLVGGCGYTVGWVLSHLPEMSGLYLPTIFCLFGAVAGFWKAMFE